MRKELPHKPNVWVCIDDNTSVPLSVRAMAPGSAVAQVAYSDIPPVRTSESDELNHFILDIEHLDPALDPEHGEDYNVSGKFTDRGKRPEEFDKKNLEAVLVLDTRHQLHQKTQDELLAKLDELINYVKNIPIQEKVITA